MLIAIEGRIAQGILQSHVVVMLASSRYFSEKLASCSNAQIVRTTSAA